MSILKFFLKHSIPNYRLISLFRIEYVLEVYFWDCLSLILVWSTLIVLRNTSGELAGVFYSGFASLGLWLLLVLRI